ncbi:DUF1433 domain-containing protein [Pseudalkalibacillus hwajinpoensis]|uniref:DUF1433 domain-containing protein n=1 Tax=Guptibacillus hwajinpoensis TaxID=208199 RepID=UPI001CD32572|nr:DUF1433 domain-containing protein [Pseudalkalibacillus hwajinpoensis]MCA0993431.1 DUF1433 domain-containing protein [Pseudalkalibacillus hwajinpoensis]
MVPFYKRLFFFLTLSSLLGACGFFSQENDYDEETIDKAKKSVERFIADNYEDIESVEITRSYESEMGGLTIEGTVNDGATEFTAGVRSNFSIGHLAPGEDFPDMKEACKDQICAY